jgi:hypothetical protein
MTTIDKILEELKLYEDKVVISPLSNEEIEIIQSKFKKRMPKYFIEFLQKIGLKQDLVWGLNDGIGKFEDLEHFLPSENYFKFGDNGGEDYWLLKFEDENDRTIYEYDYYCDNEIKSSGKTFDDLLFEALEDKRTRYENLPLNTEKDWCVQFSIGTGSGKFLVSQLKDKLNIPFKVIKEPTFKETSEAGIKCYEGIVSIDGKEIPLGKQVIKGIGSADLYFNWQERIEEMKNNSIIKQIDKALSKCVFNHILIDYGILNRKELKK